MPDYALMVWHAEKWVKAHGADVIEQLADGVKKSASLVLDVRAPRDIAKTLEEAKKSWNATWEKCYV